ncbi:MAG: bifunctional nuclease family protein [Chloroflexi bacterium]|nr:bifunctional nuclease family protein [Chloroflexota bacterium]
MIELDVYSVLYSLLDRHRVILLKETHGERYLPIWIGSFESEAIVMRLQDTSIPRPMTHDLLLNTITELGGQLAYIVINDLNESTFYARLALQRGGRLQMLDARPSDAIALALRAAVPLYADESVMEKAAITVSPDIRKTQPGQDDQLGPFREFLSSLDIDDLGKQ